MLRGDLATESEVLAAVDFVERIDRPVDLLIHAAGLQSPATIATGSVEALDEHYLLNVRGPYLLTQKLLGPLGVAGGQVVFFTASESGAAEPAPGDAHHSISQAGMQAFATELRAEAARSGIRVLTVDAVAQTWTDVSGAVDGPSGGSLLTALARSVVDTLVERGVDVTELRVRQPSGSARAERR
jgi:NAD(P)-dependent dehydrogenase (short-subunit alcohol dehydrogenase family)